MKNTYGRTVFKESEKAVRVEFMDNVRLIIATLSYNVFAPLQTETEKRQYFFCRMKSSGADAKGFVSPGGFTVLKGSRLSDYVGQSMIDGKHTSYYRLRVQLEDDGTVSGKRFCRDYEFRSPSAVVRGHSSNGNADWKTEDGVRLKDIR
ncbi:MAG: DUF4357 domain-containing protein [Synergistaceae bacterium]|nr:DUF4357 domain-containing protein [Synergistaceae bacterium]